MDCLQQKGVIAFPWHLTAVTIAYTVLGTPVASCTNNLFGGILFPALGFSFNNLWLPAEALSTTQYLWSNVFCKIFWSTYQVSDLLKGLLYAISFGWPSPSLSPPHLEFSTPVVHLSISTSHVFYDLSQRIFPHSLGSLSTFLGSTYTPMGRLYIELEDRIPTRETTHVRSKHIHAAA